MSILSLHIEKLDIIKNRYAYGNKFGVTPIHIFDFLPQSLYDDGGLMFDNRQEWWDYIFRTIGLRNKLAHCPQFDRNSEWFYSHPLIKILLVTLLLASCQSTPDPSTTAESPRISTAQTEAAYTPTQTETITITPEPTPTPTLTPTSSQTPTPNEDGWQNYLYEEFAISLPHTWILLDLSAEDLGEMLSSVVDANPELDGIFTSESLKNMALMGCKLVTLDTDTESLASSSSLNIIVLHSLMEISFDDYLEYNLLQLRSQVGEEIVISQEKVLLGEIKAGKLEYETELLGHEKTVVYLQYLILNGRTQFILTFTSEKSNYVQNGPLFEKIAQSFRLVR